MTAPHLLHDGLELGLGQAGLLGQVGQDVGQQVVDGAGALRARKGSTGRWLVSR